MADSSHPSELTPKSFCAHPGCLTPISIEHSFCALHAPSDLSTWDHYAEETVSQTVQSDEALVEEARLDAKAFRENTVYDSDGDPIRLTVNAGRLDQYADALTAQARRIEELEAEVERLRKQVLPEWFYLVGDMSSDRCRFSVHEVIDEDWLWDNRAEGSAVVQIETATRCPDIWAVVHFFTDEEKDARQSDDEYEITEYATEEEARAALGDSQ